MKDRTSGTARTGTVLTDITAAVRCDGRSRTIAHIGARDVLALGRTGIRDLSEGWPRAPLTGTLAAHILMAGSGVAMTRVRSQELLLAAGELGVTPGNALFIVGTSLDAVTASARALAERFDGRCGIAGTAALGNSMDGALDRLIARVAASGANVCVLALPSRQALAFAALAEAAIPGVTFIAAGDDCLIKSRRVAKADLSLLAAG